MIEPRKMEDFSCNLAILNMPYIDIYGRYLQSIGSCCMAIDGKPMVSALENDRQMVLIRGFSVIFLCRKGCHRLLQMRRCRPLKLTQHVQVMH